MNEPPASCRGRSGTASTDSFVYSGFAASPPICLISSRRSSAAVRKRRCFGMRLVERATTSSISSTVPKVIRGLRKITRRRAEPGGPWRARYYDVVRTLRHLCVVERPANHGRRNRPHRSWMVFDDNVADIKARKLHYIVASRQPERKHATFSFRCAGAPPVAISRDPTAPIQRADHPLLLSARHLDTLPGSSRRPIDTRCDTIAPSFMTGAKIKSP
jgi:hypothetical protein